MKQTARKLLSLVMAFAIMLTLAPVALAAGEVVTVDPSDPTPGSSVNLGLSNVTIPQGAQNVSYEWKCDQESISSSTNTASYTVPANTAANTTLNFTCTIKYTPENGTSPNDDVTITASGSATVKAAEPSVSGITLDPTSLSFGASETTGKSVAATINGTNIPTDAAPTWSLDGTNKDDFQISGTGKTVSVSPKTANTGAAKSATLVATYGTGNDAVTARCPITMAAVALPADKIVLSATGIAGGTNNAYTLTINAGSSVDITALLQDANDGAVSGEVAVSGGTAGVCTSGTMSNNKVKLTAASVATQSTANFTFTYGDSVRATLAVTVVPVPTIVVQNNATSIMAGSSLTLTLQNAPSGCTVTWTGTSGLTFSPDGTQASNETTMTAASTMSPTTSAKITATVSGTNITTAKYEKTIAVTNPLTISPASKELTAFGAQQTLTAYFNGQPLNSNTGLSWSIVGATNNYSDGYISINTSATNGSVVVTAESPTNTARTVRATYVTGGATYYADCPITVKYSAQISASVTVYDSNSGYALTDTPDEGNTGSIADQIDAQVRRQYVSSYSYYYTVEFNQIGNASNRNGYLNASDRYSYYAEDLDEVVFEPTANLTSASSTAEASYGFTVRVYRNNSNTPEKTLTGLMTFKIKQGTSGGDISYVAGLGEDVYFNVADFEDFWNGTSRNTLDYVTFSAPSGGTLYNSSSRNTSSTPCYVDPTSRQTGLDGVYFSPNSTTSKKATTIRISFTAHGRNSGSKNGVVVISYLNKSASDITYSTNANGTVSLKASDFTAAYKEATGSTAPSNMTIVFQGVPTYGSLTYLDSSKRNAKEVKLTNANIKSRSFTAKTSGTNQLEDVTYTGSGTRSDTIEYIAYSGSTAQFSGKVVFNTVTAPTDVRVVLPTCTLSTGVALPPSYFTNANTAMSNASYVIFSGSPRLGRLSYANGSVTTAIPVNMLASVTYIPTGTNGTDSFNFTAYNSSNVVVASGTVSVVVSLSSTTPGGVSNINQFTDVTPTAYYRTYLSDLISRGVIKGTGSGKFDPEGTLDYSQALKFILNAAGYVVPELEGANWALNYKTLAVQNGWLSSTVVLTNPISREAMAELAAKALGIGSSSAASPFSDTTNPYAVALYNTTPKIIRGQDSSAKPAFKPNDTLKRHEMVSLVYNMYQYKAANP